MKLSRKLLILYTRSNSSKKFRLKVEALKQPVQPTGPSGDSSSNRRGRNIPWLQVVRFHKDIAARAENSFFSIKAKDADSDRWSSLGEFDLESIDGPWNFDMRQLVSQRFKSAVDQNDHESMFIGGPCFLGYERQYSGSYTPQWRPILYREVKLVQKEEGVLIEPDQGKWSLSPILTNAIDRLQVSVADDPDKLVTELLDKADNIRVSQKVTFGQAIKTALVDLIPDLADTIQRPLRGDTFTRVPSDWVLFAPTKSFSALTRYLMADYERLESLISSDPENIGGLKVLDDGAPKEEAEIPDLLPLIPLNDYQQKAVESTLGNRPLTVISGPPGCGKSQVVVSLLLNAWAAGKSVLFASNNNNAVDVVRDRLVKFEAEFPVAVRAGNRQKNNVIELLRRTINFAADPGATERVGQNRAAVRGRLEAERNALSDQLDSKLPQRADEAMRTALNGYAKWHEILEKIEAESTAFDERYTSFHLDDYNLSDLEEGVNSSRAWLKKVDQYKEFVREDAVRKTSLENKVLTVTGERNSAAGEVGLDPDTIEDWQWLSSGPVTELLAAWERQWLDVINSDIEDDLADYDWVDAYDRWSSSSGAAKTVQESSRFAETVRARMGELAPQVADVQKSRQELDSSTQKLQEAGLEERSDLEIALIYFWTSLYSNLITLPKSRWDFLPWSKPSKLRRQLKAQEALLRQHIPLAKWSEIGALNDQGRAKLALAITDLRYWKESFDVWQSQKSQRHRVEKQFEELRSSAGSLSLTPIPLGQCEEDWQRISEQSLELSRLAQSAEEAWILRVKRKKALDRVNGVLRQWRQLASGHPIREAWSEGVGAEFCGLLETLQTNPSPESLIAARASYYKGSLKIWERAWKNAADAQQRIFDLSKEIKAIPQERDRIQAWFNQRPDMALVVDECPDAWRELSATGKELKKLEELMKEHRHFVDEAEPAWIEEAENEREWSEEKLRDAIEVLPEGDPQSELVTIFIAIAKRESLEWPVDEISQFFREFSPEIIRAQIDRINAELEQGSFEESKAAWLKRLQTDEDALHAVDQLEKSLRRKSGRVEESDFGIFREALRLVPIWITTAQAAQSIPLEPELFDLVVIDEASQCTLTNLLPLLYRGKRLAIIGDSEQLPSIPCIGEAEETTLARKHEVEEFLPIIGHASNDVYTTAADALPRGRAGVLQLNEHFRSNPQIIGFSNRHIYQQRLILKTDLAKDRLPPIASGLHSVNVNGQAVKGERGRSWKNVLEAHEVIQRIKSLKSDESLSHLSLGVVTPFAPQKDLIREMLKDEGIGGDILVDSAYGFQGDERDIMIFSAVVSSGISPGACRWVESPPNLVNVALTRARHALFVVADFEFCMQQDPTGILRKLAEYCKDVQSLRDSSPAELELFSWMTLEGWNPEIHPRIGDLEVDFVLKDEKGGRLVVEVDGEEAHKNSRQSDQSRDAFLRAQGCNVFRTAARAVLETPYAVIQEIKEKLAQ